MIEIGLVGNIALDITSYLGEQGLGFFPSNQETIPCKNTLEVGGSVLNLGRAVKAAGATTSILSTYKKDALGLFLSARLEAQDFQKVLLHDVLESNNITNLIVAKDGNKKILYQRSPFQEALVQLMVEKTKLEKFTHFSLNEWSKRLLVKKAPGMLFSTDLHQSLDLERDKNILAFFDVVFISGNGVQQPEQLISEIAQIEPDITLVMTLDEKGSLIFHSGKLWSIPAFPIEKVVDTVGCGDIYAGTFLTLFYGGRAPAEAGVFASYQASKNCLQAGTSVEDLSRSKLDFRDLIDDVERAVRYLS